MSLKREPVALIEHIGRFRLYPLDTRSGGWSMSYDQVWLPVILADRDACMVVIGLVLAGVHDGVLEKIQKRALGPMTLEQVTGRYRPTLPQNVTVDMIIASMGEPS